MSNFANWEITEMLPNNPYLDYDSTEWTWEDIRLYLESKDYHISISRNLNRTWGVTVFIGEDYYVYDSFKNWNNDDMWEEYEFYKYEEAREEAIKYCLNKIKEDGKIR